MLDELPFGLVVPVVLPPEPLVKKATSYIEVNIRTRNSHYEALMKEAGSMTLR